MTIPTVFVFVMLAALGEPDELVLLAGCDVHAAASTRAPTASAAARHLRIGWTRSLTGCSLLVPPTDSVAPLVRLDRAPAKQAAHSNGVSTAQRGTPCRSTS